jgi:hypothetical protein
MGRKRGALEMKYILVFLNLCLFIIWRKLSCGIRFKCVVTSVLYVTHLLNWLFTYSLEQSPSWKANWFCSWSKNFPHLWNPKVRYRTRKCPPPVPILSPLHPIPTTPFHFLKIHLNTLRMGDANLRFLRFCITTVEDEWCKSAFLTRAWFPRTSLHNTWGVSLNGPPGWMFKETWPRSELMIYDKYRGKNTHPQCVNIILLSTSGSPQWSRSLRLPHQNPVHTSPLPQVFLWNGI